jgi:EAL domain-containing protein (putative c-di-GMP-specific phosphodiesterase class I)
MAARPPISQMRSDLGPMVKQTIDKKAANTESLLLDYTHRIARYAQGRRAIVIHLSRLRPDNRRVPHLRIAANTFESLVKQFDGQIFLLQNADMVFVCKSASIRVIDEAITRLRYLFGDDPLAAEIEEDGPDRFATWYDLERDYKEFLAYVETLHVEQEKLRKRLAHIAGTVVPEELRAMDPAALVELLAAIERADLSNVMRRQAICTLADNEAPKPVFRELYISIADLRDAIMPHRDITTDRWLFQYLTQALDKRLLSLLRKNDDQAIAHSFSLNLNISTLLSQEFLQFDQGLRASARGSIVVELQKIDVFADLGAYVFARDFLQQRGYRVCLDDVSAMALSLLDREKLGLDLVKMFWTPDMGDVEAGEHNGALAEAIERTGRARIILARCDSEEAVSFGRSMGFRLFQGRYIDRLLNTPGVKPFARSAG